MTPQLFDALVLAVMLVGIALASVRFYQDMTRPLPPRRSSNMPVNSAEQTKNTLDKP
jgi:hypothetical protein